MRRQILFNGLDEVLNECESLLKNGYVRHGNWTLGQICRHLGLTIAANTNGYPRWMTII
ncbi:MAG: DUF1569 domain-containing protein, partial [Planctomycetota bacterium]